METRNNERFSQKHPFLFGSLLIVTAVALILGAMAASRLFDRKLAGGLSGQTLGVCHISGLIMSSGETVDWLQELRDDGAVKGVLLRIDSPGGAIGPSQEIFEAVRDLAKTKPVVSSFGSVAASGGYYVAAPSTMIVANPGSLTASIGVLMEYLDVQQLIERFGIRQELLASGKNKGAGSPFRSLTPEQRTQIMSVIMDLHEQFVGDVADSRNMTRKDVQALADGRALTGRQAQKAGLVDRLGGEQEALQALKELCGLTEADVSLKEGPPDKRDYLERLLDTVQRYVPEGRWSLPSFLFRFP
ncbi:signal peptide peptidase SppA [Desulfovibrio aminophilus]|uniref:signal peptide peptidase SppA n=1 Tax=Desulfovibrio aminophilus TaxID=81425 RepID=UPI0033925877